jgi:hypothetical protein
MTIPTASAYPGALDSSTTLFGDPVDAVSLTLDGTINDAVTTFIVHESISTINVPTFLAFSTGEIVYCEAKDNGTKTFSSVVRGATPQTHLDGDAIKLIMVSEYIKQFKKAIIAIEGKVGITGSAVTTSVDYFNNNHTHSGVAGQGVAIDIAPTQITPQGTTSTLDADLLDGQHSTYFGTATAVSSSLTKELPLMAGMAPLSGYAASALELVESGGAGTAKPVIPQLLFDDATAQGRMWVFDVRETPGATVTLSFLYRMAGANTSKHCIFGCQIACISATDGSTQNKVFDTTNTVTLDVPDTANVDAVGTITLTNKDGIAKGDWVCLFLYRDAAAGGEDAAGNAIIRSVYFNYV